MAFNGESVKEKNTTKVSWVKNHNRNSLISLSMSCWLDYLFSHQECQ